jgi:hypothetical protein
MGNDQEVMERVVELCPKLDGYEKVGAYGYGVSYLVE